MTPSRRDHIVKLATAIAQHRGRTVPALASGCWPQQADQTFDGRAEVAGDADGFAIERSQQ